MSITEAGQGPLFPSLSKNLKYKTKTFFIIYLPGAAAPGTVIQIIEQFSSSNTLVQPKDL